MRIVKPMAYSSGRVLQLAVAFAAIAMLVGLFPNYAFSAAASVQAQNVITPVPMVATFSCPSGVAQQNTYEPSSSTTLTSDVCANYVIIPSGVTLSTNGFAIYAIDEFVNNGVVENLDGGAGGAAYSDASSGTAQNGNNAGSYTYLDYGGDGGAGNHQSGCLGGCWGNGGSGGGGPNAYGYYEANALESDGANFSGGGGGGGAYLGGGSNGGKGGGYIMIYADRFINNNIINASGSPGAGGVPWPGAGGGGGYIKLNITTENPNYVVLGTIYANGGNGGALSSSSYCGGAGGGGGGVVNITVEPGILRAGNEGDSYSSVTAFNGTASPESNPPCENGDPGTEGSVIISNFAIQKAYSGCTGAGDSYSQTDGYCVFVTTTSITTSAQNDYGGEGSLATVTSQSENSPVTANEIAYTNESAQWLLTCPLAPNVLNTTEYFETNNNSFIGGDRCLASDGSLNTIFTINTVVSWTENTIANSTTTFSVYDPGIITIQNLGFLGQADLPISGNAVISNAYDSQAYLFNQLPTQEEAGAWTWNIVFANFSNFKPSNAQQLTQRVREFPKPGSSFNDLKYVNQSDSCTYYYTFSEGVKFDGISNHNMPVPVQLTSYLPTRIQFPNNTVAEANTAKPSPQNTNGGPLSGCGVYLFYDGGVYGGGECSALTPYSLNVVTNNARFFYNNNKDSGGGAGCNPLLPAYECGGNSYVYTTNDPAFVDDYLVANASSKDFGFASNFYVYAIPQSVVTFNSVNLLPYFLYNFSTPATTSDINGRAQYLNESFDMYSPTNYLDPNSLDPFALHTGSGFFATVDNSSGSYLAEFPLSEVETPSNSAFDNPDIHFISSLNSSQQSGATSIVGSIANTLFGKTVGGFKEGYVGSPSFVLSAPNDYVYILNHTTKNGFFTSTTDSILFTTRFIPAGYYNLTNLQPNFVTNTLYTSNDVWDNAWKTYWSAALIEQSQNFYVTNVTPITSSTSKVCFSWSFHCIIDKGAAAVQKFIPTSMATDYADDKFLAGVDTGLNNKLELVASFSNGTYVTAEETSDAGFPLPQYLASTAGGQFLYLSNNTYPNIPMFSSNTLQYVRNISLSYSNVSYGLNITSYLAHGGPFGSSQIAQAYANQANVMDTNSNHHPIAIFDYGDLLYVVDNWTFTVNGFTSSIWMLRVFFPNGTQVEIDPAAYDDMILNSSLGSSINYNVGSSSAALSNPPYGWPISANISIGNGKYVSYCIQSCTYGPSDGISYKGYYPIGPLINSHGLSGPENQTGFYMDYNGTVYMVSHDLQLSPSFSSFGFAGCTLFAFAAGDCQGVYTEFLRFRPDIINYTKISLGAYAPYSCLLNVTPDKQNSCTNNNYISEIYPPFAAAPSSSKFVFGEGAAATYYDADILAQSLFPNGAGAYTSNSYVSSQTSSQESNTLGTSGTFNSITGNTILPSALSKLTNEALFTNLTTSLGGYALLPYNVTYSISKSWTLIRSNPSSCSNPFPASNTIVYNGISAFQINVTTPSNSVIPIDGGPTYLDYLQQKNTYYNANLSDADLILPPSIGYYIFTNRLFGQININQSVNNSIERLVPLIINATRLYNYKLNTVEQSVSNPNFKNPPFTYNGFAIEQIATANALALPIYGSNMITTSNVFTGNNLLSYSNATVESYTNILQQYSFFKYLDTIGLTLFNDPQALGYNRLLYDFQDAFNNTIYAPVDVDLANTTIIDLAVNPIINALNPNETTLQVNGTAGYYTGLYTQTYSPLPAGSDIYLYYDTQFNYFNKTYQPGTTISEEEKYYEYDQNCAFGINPGENCTLANPLSEYIQGPIGASEANTITFHTQYNSSGDCALPPKQSLLNVSVPINCNIYGYNGLPAVVPPGYEAANEITSYWRYCQPDFLNGSGSLTSQLGLAAIVTTNANGAFSTNTINVCGTGAATLKAAYFGGPYPEPQIYNQYPITGSVLSLSVPSSTYDAYISAIHSCEAFGLPESYCEEFYGPLYGIPSPIKTFEYNYTNAPNLTAVSFDTGSYFLSFGDISLVITALAIAGIMAYMYFSPKAYRSKRKRANK